MPDLDATTSLRVSDTQLERIIFGPECKWCSQTEPCDCERASPGTCACVCGRCLFDGPLPGEWWPA